MELTGGSGLRMTRGDDETLVVSCPDRPFGAGDVVELTVRRYAGRGEALIRKRVEEFTGTGKAVVRFTPEDTSNLAFGVYSYDVQATFTDLGVKTIVKPSDFAVEKENTYDG